MATTPDEVQGPTRFQRVSKAAKEVVSSSNVTRVVASAAVLLAIGVDRPGTAVPVASLLFILIGKK